jgi:hypothetical protein
MFPALDDSAEAAPATKDTDPPGPVSPPPTLNDMDSPCLVLERPVITDIPPEDPPLAVPVDKEREPLIPLAPDSAEVITTLPLDALVLDPETKFIPPPLAILLSPAFRVTSAPSPEDAPTLTSIPSELPVNEFPVSTEIVPESVVESPEITCNLPLFPEAPAS